MKSHPDAEDDHVVSSHIERYHPKGFFMLESVKKILKEFTFLSPKDILHLASIMKLVHVKKGDYLVREGQYNYYAIHVITGLLYHFIITENGEERTLLFVPEKNISGSLQCLIKGNPSDENIVALENSLLVMVDIRELEKLAYNNLRILRLLDHHRKQVIFEAAMRIKFLIAHSLEERYIHFNSIYPKLEQRVKQKDLASFLGITVSSLSRIRARLAK